jgi:hypothetical protein
MMTIEMNGDENEEDFNVILYMSPPIVPVVSEPPVSDAALWALRSASRWPTS